MRLEQNVVDGWLAAHPGWSRDETGALVRWYEFPSYAATMGFVVALGVIAEKRDHHPDMLVTWGRVRVQWSTHDAGGVTELDLELAEATGELVR